MLIVINLLIIVFLIGFALLWATYGFFSSFIHLITVIAAGAVAFAVWEPITHGFLLGQKPDMAWGIGLLGPFILCLIGFRALTNRISRENLHFVHLADQIGGGALGLCSGVLTAGILLLGTSYIPMGSDLLGYQPYKMDRHQIVDGEKTLWPMARVDEWTASFFETLSGGSLSPIGGPSMADVKDDLARRAALYRLAEDEKQSRSAHPDAVTVEAAYPFGFDADGADELVPIAARGALTPLLQDPNILDGVDAGTDGAPLIAAVLAAFEAGGSDAEAFFTAAFTVTGTKLEIEEPEENVSAVLDAVLNDQIKPLLAMIEGQAAGDSTFVLIDTLWDDDPPGTYDSDSWLRLATPQIRLRISTGDSAEGDYLAPIAYAREEDKITGERILIDLTDGTPAAYAQSKGVHIAFLFVVPSNAQVVRFEARDLRFNLSNAFLYPPDPAPLSDVALVMGAPNIVEIEEVIRPDGAVWVGAEGAGYAQVTESLPTTVSANQANNIEQDQTTEPWTALSGSEKNIGRGGGGGRTLMREVYVPDGFRLVRLRINRRSAQSLYGRAVALATAIRLKDDAGSVHEMIGYCLVHTEANTLDLWLRENNGRTVMSSQLPNVPPGDELYLYFQVPENTTITGFMVGNSVDDSGEFLEDLEVKPE